MDNNKLILGTIAGGLANFLAGFLLYGIALRGFFEANQLADVLIDPPRWLWLVIGNLGFGAVVTYVFQRWTGITTAAAGLKAGAVLGLLLGLAYNLTWFGTADLMTLTAHLVDTGVSAAMFAVVGAAVGTVLGRD